MRLVLLPVNHLGATTPFLLGWPRLETLAWEECPSLFRSPGYSWPTQLLYLERHVNGVERQLQSGASMLSVVATLLLPDTCRFVFLVDETDDPVSSTSAGR